MHRFFSLFSYFFFFNDTATTEIYTLSLHDALPILRHLLQDRPPRFLLLLHEFRDLLRRHVAQDRMSTRLNSSHTVISYAVFCLKKKKKIQHITIYIYEKKNNTNINKTK